MPVKRTSAGLRSYQSVALSNAGPRVRNNDGTYDTPREPLTPATAWASVEIASPKAMEQVARETTIGTATHLVTIPYHPQVTLQTQVTWTDRFARDHTANVVGYSNPDQKCIETVMLCVERML